MRGSRWTVAETGPRRLMMSENRSSSVILCSVSRARSSGDSSAALEVLEVVCAKAGSVPADTITAAEPVSFDNCRRVNHVRITTFLCADRNQPKFRAQSQRRWHRLGRVAPANYARALRWQALAKDWQARARRTVSDVGSN